jgi:hypothetical protein
MSSTCRIGRSVGTVATLFSIFPTVPHANLEIVLARALRMSLDAGLMEFAAGLAAFRLRGCGKLSRAAPSEDEQRNGSHESSLRGLKRRARSMH